MGDLRQDLLTLVVDVGGSGIKAMVLNPDGIPVTERIRVETPRPAKPQLVIDAIANLAKVQGEFDRISVGFPGVVRNGITARAVNLDPEWDCFDLGTALTERLGKPARIANDADVQGLGSVSGTGVELVVTLGTGFGSAIFVDGKLVPNLELGHHRFSGGKTYEERLGNAALEKAGQKVWNRRLSKAIASLSNLFNYDYLYIGGGNAKLITVKLPENVKIVSNVSGLLGGIKLWH
jgi:polyphosphate glucokinase